MEKLGQAVKYIAPSVQNNVHYSTEVPAVVKFVYSARTSIHNNFNLEMALCPMSPQQPGIGDSRPRRWMTCHLSLHDPLLRSARRKCVRHGSAACNHHNSRLRYY